MHSNLKSSESGSQSSGPKASLRINGSPTPRRSNVIVFISRWRTSIFLILIGLFAYRFFGTDGIQSGSRAPEFSVQEVAPTGASGKSLTLASYRGKVLVIDFWATWCQPCVDSLPKVNALYESYRNRGVGVLGVSMEDLPTLQAFLPNSGVGYPVARDVNQEMNQAYRIDSFPTLVVVSKSGRVIYSESPPDFDAVRRVLDRELANG